MTERIIDNQIRLPPIIGMMRCPCCGIGTGISVSRWIAEMRHTMWNFCMYDYLSTRGDCCYIEYEGTLVGDVSLQNNAELPLW